MRKKREREEKQERKKERGTSNFSFAVFPEARATLIKAR